jgi:hypothetical protein
MCKTVFIISLFLVMPAITSAATTHTGFEENTAQAFFSSVQGCEDVVVGVSVVEPESVRPRAPLAPIQAFIFGSFQNICDIGSSYSFAGVVELTSQQFDQEGLKSAFLNLSTNIGGFDITLALDWEGVGKMERDKNKIRIKSISGILYDSDVITSRDAEISGTFVVNGINYGVGIETGGLSTMKAETIEIEK